MICHGSCSYFHLSAREHKDMSLALESQSANCLLFSCKVSFSILWTISLDRVITALWNDSGVEAKLIRLRGRRSVQTS